MEKLLVTFPENGLLEKHFLETTSCDIFIFLVQRVNDGI